MKEKIFGIGLPRTGNTSLCTAFGILGYSAFHAPRNWDELTKHDALTEVIHDRFPYHLLSQFYPNALYILTIRDLQPWLESCHKHQKKASRFPAWNPFWTQQNDWMKLSHDKIKTSERFESLLVLDVCGGDGWEKLCPFLGKPIPDQPFPCRNPSLSWNIPLL